MTRKEAREYIIKHCNPHRDTGTKWDDAMECAIKALEEPEKGKWRRMSMACYGGGTITEYECSVCKEHEIVKTDFCPNCGADMRQQEPHCTDDYCEIEEEA